MENRAAFEDYVQQTIGKLSEADKLELARLLGEISVHISALMCPGAGEQEVPAS
jgi:hypothetical protein